MDDRTGAKVLAEKIRIQSRAGEDQFQRRELLKHLPQFGQEEIGQAVALVHLVLFTHSERHFSSRRTPRLLKIGCGSLLTTITCVTVDTLASPAISVLRNTPLVQKVSTVLGDTLRGQFRGLRKAWKEWLR